MAARRMRNVSQQDGLCVQVLMNRRDLIVAQDPAQVGAPHVAHVTRSGRRSGYCLLHLGWQHVVRWRKSGRALIAGFRGTPFQLVAEEMIDLAELLVRIGPKTNKLQRKSGVPNASDHLLQAGEIKL